MRTYAIALRPGGNIRAYLWGLFRDRLRSGGYLRAAGLPEALYLGFYERKNASDSDDAALGKAAASLMSELWPAIPSPLHITSIVKINSRFFLGPEHPLALSAALTCERIAARLDLSPLENPPIEPCIGFFASSVNQPRDFIPFSFKAMEAIFLALDTEDPEYRAVSWKVLGQRWRRKSE